MTTLTRAARETIKWHWEDFEAGARTTIAGYTRHNFGDQGWRAQGWTVAVVQKARP